MDRYRTDSVDNAAEGIFGMLSDDFMVDSGSEQDEEPAGEEQDQVADSGDEDDFDDEATAALTDDESEDDEESEEEDEESEESEEDEEAEEEESEEEESEDDEEDEDGADDDDDPLVSVKVDGKTEEIPLSKALAGYSRTASWTKKSQALAEERKAFETERARVAQERQDYGAKLQTLEEQLGAKLMKIEEPNPDDPNFERKWIEFQQTERAAVRVQQERYALQQKMDEDYVADRKVKIAEQNTLLVEAVPEWSDTEVADAGKKSLATYAIEVMGFGEEEVEQLIDHRLVLLLKKAAAYDSMKEAKKTIKGKVKKARVLKAGQSSRKSSSKAKKKGRVAKVKRDRLREEGSLGAAADYIFDTLEDFDE